MRCSFQPTGALTFAAAAVLLAVGSARSAEPATRTVEAGDLKLAVPETWQQKPATSTFRKAQFTIPKEKGDKEDAELVVFHFEGGGGGVDANVARWINQFEPKARKVKTAKGQGKQGEYVLVDLQGTYKKPIGPPIQQRTVRMPEARMIGVIQTVGGENYFLRLAGPEKTVSANLPALRTALGADEKSEKEFKPAPGER
jgi:gluconolactonase